MAKVYLTTNNYDHPEPLERIRQLADLDISGKHLVVDDVNSADLIVFIATAAHDPFFHALQKNQILKDYAKQSRVVCESDYAIPFVSGVYANIEKRWYDKNRYRAGPYFCMYQNDAVEHNATPIENPHLYSFVGDSQTNRCRQELLGLNDKRAYLQDTHQTGQKVRRRGSPEEVARFNTQYASIIHDSMFILCPRGFSVSSARLYDTLKAGRVPIIISDDWVAPEGPDWDRFCLFVKESRIKDIPHIVRQAEADYERMSKEAYEAYQAWFSDEVLFHRIIDWCLEIEPSSSWYNATAIKSIFSKKHFKRYSKMLVKKYILN